MQASIDSFFIQYPKTLTLFFSVRSFAFKQIIYWKKDARS